MKKYSWIVLILMMALFSCNKNEDSVSNVEDHDHEEEVITKLKLTVNDNVSYAFSDPDGEGGDAPTVDTIRLVNGFTYTMDLSVWNQTEDPEVDVTEEIAEEKDEHILCFSPSTVGLNITRTDKDSNDLEVGLTSSWEVTSAGTGSVTISLKHQPDGAKDGTCAPGETDIEVTFPVVVENANVLIAF